MSLLQLPDLPDVAWARLLQGAGEGGSYAYQIDASGLDLRNRMMYRKLIPNGGSPSMKTRLRLKSTLQTNNPAFEGIAVRHRGYQLTGSVPTQADKRVWDSAPENGRESAWYSVQSGTFTDVVFIESVPPDLGIDYITFELVVRAASGQVTISNCECRNHYAVETVLPVPERRAYSSSNANYQIERMSSEGSGDVVRYITYMSAHQLRIEKGKLISVITEGNILVSAFESRDDGSGSRLLNANSGMMVKLRRTNAQTQYDYFTVSRTGNGSLGNRSLLDQSEQFRSDHDYNQLEVIPFIEPDALSDGYDNITPGVLFLRDLTMRLVVTDYLAPTQ